ncbi:MAG: maleylpyruvate isomerase family mycothiol-dependent enzyme [Marmoricola sp.]
MSDAELLAGYIATWKSACAAFIALGRSLTPDQLHLPTDLDGWDVFDNVAHTAHLEHVLATGEEETIQVEKAPHIKSLTGLYTEQGVAARRERDLDAVLDELEAAVATRSAALEADPPTDGTANPPRTPGSVGWNNETLLGNRPLDIWMHEQDIRRAIGRPGGYDSPAAAHTIRRLAGGLPLVLGKRVAPPAGTSVRIDIDDAGVSLGAIVGEDGRAKFTVVDEPTARIAMSAETFVVLAGGRRSPDGAETKVSGDEALAKAVLENLAITP